MKNIKTVTVREIKVQLNSPVTKDWARIVDAQSGQILHTGRLPYIKRVASKRYNKTVKL